MLSQFIRAGGQLTFCFAAFVSALASGCGTEFDSIAQLEGVRVMGVHKSAPYSKPGDSVDLALLYHDAVDAPRDLETLWISGCENPPGDLYAVCLELIGPALRGDLPAEATGGQEPSESPFGGGLSPDELLRVGIESKAERVVVGPGLAFGFQETFSLGVERDIISSKPPSRDPKLPGYGLNYVFFAVCAGELHLDVESTDFPLRCLDEDGEILGATDFVLGYTAVYSYEQQTNTNPELLGVEVDGERLDRKDICIGLECDFLEVDEDRECNASDPVVNACEDEESDDCPKIEIKAIVDPKSVEENGILTITQGSPVEEQMWVNYHTDNGEFTFDVALVNDADSGFNPETETEFVAPEKQGPAQVWSVVRDSRGGTTWARFQVCVQ